MRKLTATIFFLLMLSLPAHAQNLVGTFQGEIEGVSPLILHLKVGNGLVDGFYKYLADTTVVFLKGTLNDDWNFSLTGTDDLSTVLTGRISGRVIEGDVVLAGKDKHPFYAVDFRGEYSNENNSGYFRLSLSERGYVLKSLTNSEDEAAISTFRDENGGICLMADSLNTRIYLDGDLFFVELDGGVPAFIPPANDYVDGDLYFSLVEEFWSSDSYAEFPGKDEDYNPEGSRKALNDTVSVRLKRIPRSEYIVGKWAAPPVRTYREITDYDEAEKLLAGKLNPLWEYNAESDERFQYGTEITYNDGTRKEMDWLSVESCFRAYYADLDILVIENEACGDEVLDFNDSSGAEKGHPAKTATSPGGLWRVTGYYPGGAADRDQWWLERWNPSLERYELFDDFKNDYSQGNPPAFMMPEYIHGFFWTDNNTVLFKELFGAENCYKLEIVTQKTFKNE